MARHPEVFKGFCPTYILAGAGYDFKPIIEGNKTELQLLVGIGYQQRMLWQDKDTGEVITDNPIVYDTVRSDIQLRFKQGFGKSRVNNKDLITLTLAGEVKAESNVDSIVKGEMRSYYKSHEIQSLDGYIGSNYSGSIFPDLNGDRKYLGTYFSLQMKYDQMDDRKTASDGFLFTVDLRKAPTFINNSSDFNNVRLNAVLSKTVYEKLSNGKNVFSVTVIDRANLTYLGGNKIPVAVQETASLGRLVRGYNPFSYGTELAMVNNFDIRLAGPDMGVKGIFPRINLFFDIGYGRGKYYNTSITGDNLLSSCGAQFTISFFDFMDLGYQVAYLFSGSKYTDGPDKKLVGCFTFFLDF
ncbi:MAG: hypothetical protein K6G51_06530 [Sphaerochaetaceae bacterium]|nr:hypothetical protein [Sphaerochaetaceae bacterium]